MEGEYNGVVYQSVDKFNPQDNFNVLIFHRAWTQPMLMKVKARKTAVGFILVILLWRFSVLVLGKRKLLVVFRW